MSQAPLTDEAGRPRFYADPGTDRFAAVVLRLASELWIARERIATMERLAESAGVMAAGAVDRYEPSPDEARERAAALKVFIDTIFAPLREKPPTGDPTE